MTSISNYNRTARNISSSWSIPQSRFQKAVPETTGLTERDIIAHAQASRVEARISNMHIVARAGFDTIAKVVNEDTDHVTPWEIGLATDCE